MLKKAARLSHTDTVTITSRKKWRKIKMKRLTERKTRKAAQSIWKCATRHNRKAGATV